MRYTLFYTLFLPLLPAFPLIGTGQPRQVHPNIIIINMDDMGYGDTEPFGMTDIPTPNFNRLAKEGMRFTHFEDAQPVCSPSRAALLTGCYPNRVGISGSALAPWDRRALDPREETIASLLKQAGYTTGMLGKWHLGSHPPFLPIHYGFDSFYGLPYSHDMWPVDFAGHPVTDPENVMYKYPPLPILDGDKPVAYNRTLADQGRLTSALTERALHFITANRQHPFFLYLAHPMPHVPLVASDKFSGRSGHGPFGDVIMELDWSIGQILDRLDKEDLSSNTLLIVTSDNGPWLKFGDHAGSSGGLSEGKMVTAEGGTRVPCFIRWPGKIKAGSICSQLLTNMDLLPTISALTGAPLPKQKIDGISFADLLLGRTTIDPREVFFYYYGENSLEAVRYKNWKLVFPHPSLTYRLDVHGRGGFPGKTSNVKVPMALYDLIHDPGESYDLQSQYPEIVQKLSALAEGAREDLGDELTGKTGKNRRPAAVATLPDTTSVIYKNKGRPLRLTIYNPTGFVRNHVYPAIVFFFGGSWVNGSTVQFVKHAEYFASRGMVAILADYRIKSRDSTTPFDAVMDAKSVFRYVRAHASALHIDGNRIVGAGGSAGGHLAAAAATLPGLNDPGDDTTISAKPDALVLFNPVIDNGPNGFGYAKVGDRYREISPIDNITGPEPPTIIFFGTADQVVPVATAQRYKQRMEETGNRCELFLYKDQKHGFFNYNNKDLTYYNETLRRADEFLVSLGYLEGKPSIGGIQQIDSIPLYTRVPNSTSVPDSEYRDSTGAQVFKVSVPTLTVYHPAPGTGNGAAVIICPGGSYRTLMIKREGADVAAAFTAIGVTAFVLKYRLPSDITMPDKSIGPLQDAQQAIRLVRLQAARWQLDPHRIGIMGFSAGGHLASLAATHFDEPQIEDSGSISLRPDFLILAYPVISMEDSLTHRPSAQNLLGTHPEAARIRYFSSDEHIRADMPGVLLFHASDDRAVSVRNSLSFYKALLSHKVPVEMHLFYKGDHGFLQYPSFSEWFALCRKWLESNDLLTKNYPKQQQDHRK
jgi:arylsulfatase